MRSKLIAKNLELLGLRRLTPVLHGETGGAVLLQQHMQVAALLERLVSVVAGLNTTDVMVLNCIFRYTATAEPNELIEPREISVATGYSTARISESLKRLETRKYVRRIAERNLGAGKREVALTARGRMQGAMYVRRLDTLQLILSEHVYLAPSGRSGKLMQAAALLTPMAQEADKAGIKTRKRSKPKSVG